MLLLFSFLIWTFSFNDTLYFLAIAFHFCWNVSLIHADSEPPLGHIRLGFGPERLPYQERKRTHSFPWIYFPVLEYFSLFQTQCALLRSAYAPLKMTHPQLSLSDTSWGRVCGISTGTKCVVFSYIIHYQLQYGSSGHEGQHTAQSWIMRTLSPLMYTNAIPLEPSVCVICSETLN